jgi:hypothetical protein
MQVRWSLVINSTIRDLGSVGLESGYLVLNRTLTKKNTPFSGITWVPAIRIGQMRARLKDLICACGLIHNSINVSIFEYTAWWYFIFGLLLFILFLKQSLLETVHLLIIYRSGILCWCGKNQWTPNFYFYAPVAMIRPKSRNSNIRPLWWL